MTRAQDREDELVLEHFGSFKGRFLDIGALDGQTGSNTLLLAEHGWSGVYVEASWQCLPALIATSKRFPGTQVVQGLIAPQVGLVPFWCCPVPGHSTASAPLQARGCGREGASKIYAPAFTPLQLLEALPGPYHFVSIDIEGLTLRVAEQIPWDAIECQALCLEAFPAEILGEDERPIIRRFFEGRGWRLLADTSENVVMVR
jgi:hypothetical protein